MTDNSNYIVDLYFDTPIKDAQAGEPPEAWEGGQPARPARAL